jgi:signal transduction histidine kinase
MRHQGFPWRPDGTYIATRMTQTSHTDGGAPDVQTVAGIAAIPTILDVVCRTTGMGFAAVARVTEGKWTACAVRDTIDFGLPAGGELPIETTICREIQQHHEPIIISDVSTDAIYCTHAAPALYGFQSYISFPIMLADGQFFGTLCAIDPKPHPIDTPEIIGSFRLFAELIAFHLDAHTQLAKSQAVLSQEREVSELREQFIAVLGHDLRNPLAAVSAGARMMVKYPDRAAVLAANIEHSIARMDELIGNLMDFAHGRLGSGLKLNRDAEAPLGPALTEIVQECRDAHPGRAIVANIELTRNVSCDPSRIAQLLANLLGNALAHGDPALPVKVQASTLRGDFVLSVANAGSPIPQDVQDRLFQPFFRGADTASQEGLGLGLYIVSEIARAHHGAVTVVSTKEQTCFTLRMPADLRGR